MLRRPGRQSPGLLVHGNRDYGYNNDSVAYFLIDTLQGGENSEDDLLWVNHEYPIGSFVLDYSETKSRGPGLR